MQHEITYVSFLSFSIVIVPGVATLPPEAWLDSTGSWIQALLTSTGPRAQVWIYNYTFLESSTTFMQKVLGEGTDLLNHLMELPQTVGDQFLFRYHNLSI